MAAPPLEPTLGPAEPPDADPVQDPPEPERSHDAPTWPEIKRLREEAGKRRHQLRTVEAERDQLAARVERQDRETIERAVGDRLVDASDIWTVGEQLSAFFTADGELDAEKVDETVKRLIESKPHYAPPPTNFNGGVRRSVSHPASFGEALKRRLGGA
jgi:hypothetical protein